MSTQSKIEQQVMAGVGVIYAARKATSRFAFECYGLALSVAGAAYFVSLPNVFANFTHVMQGGLPSTATFIVAAIAGTKLVVQIAVAIGGVALLAMAVDLVRSATTPSARRFA